MLNTILRLVLAVWTVGFLVISCGPMLSGDLGATGVGLLVGSVLFVPWLLGILVLGILVWLTNPRR